MVGSYYVCPSGAARACARNASKNCSGNAPGMLRRHSRHGPERPRRAKIIRTSSIEFVEVRSLQPQGTPGYPGVPGPGYPGGLPGVPPGVALQKSPNYSATVPLLSAGIPGLTGDCVAKGNVGASRCQPEIRSAHLECAAGPLGTLEVWNKIAFRVPTRSAGTLFAL
jgi:hypothetical protein